MTSFIIGFVICALIVFLWGLALGIKDDHDG